MRDKILKILPSKLKSWRLDVIKSFLDLGIINHNVILAGGAIRSTLIKEENSVADFDIFFRDLNYVGVTRGILVGLGAKLLFACPIGHLFTYSIEIGRARYKIQLISELPYPSPEALISVFDIDAGAACYDGNYFYFNTRMIRACKTKEIGLLSLSHPNSTFKRVMKYAAKGFGINKFIQQYVDELVKMGSNGVVLSADSRRFYID